MGQNNPEIKKPKGESNDLVSEMENCFNEMQKIK